MSRAPWISEIRRWMPAVGAVVGAFYGALFLRVNLLFLPFPRDLAEPAAGFLMGSAIVIAGSLFAPRRQFLVAIVLCVFSASLGLRLLNLPFLGTLAGGLVAVAFVACWFYARRTTRSKMWVGTAAGGAVLSFISLLCVRYVDWPTHPDPLPSRLARVLGTNASRVTAFYSYDLGGFIDSQSLWCVDAKPEVIELMVSGFGLESTNVVPQRFWRMPPHYWPHSMPADGEAFQSLEFFAESRGPDGDHFFMVHDRNRERAFVWFKSNF